jgi:hypothetical protein
MTNKGTILALAIAVAFPMTATARGVVDVSVQIPLPTIRFETRPPLVVVSEGVQVVPDYPEEVYYRDGSYWHRSEGRWYRARDHRGGWVLVERRRVPVLLVGIPAGKYKHHKHKQPKHKGGNGHAGHGGHGKHKHRR